MNTSNTCATRQALINFSGLEVSEIEPLVVNITGGTNVQRHLLGAAIGASLAENGNANVSVLGDDGAFPVKLDQTVLDFVKPFLAPVPVIINAAIRPGQLTNNSQVNDGTRMTVEIAVEDGQFILKEVL